jgi:hypothetical protein
VSQLQLVKELVMTSDGKGCHKSWLAAKQRVHQRRGQFQLRVSIRAKQQSSEQSCRRTDPAILEERQRVKIQCEDSASKL